MNLSEFINENAVPKIEITYVPSTSEHASYAKKVLNKILAEHPEWANPLIALSTLPAQLWAQEIRESQTDKRYINIVFVLKKTLRLRINSEKANRIAGYVAQTVKGYISQCQGHEGDCLRAIHLGEKDVSWFIISHYYEKAVTEFCEKQNDTINKIFGKMMEIYEEIGAEEKMVYHDFRMLFIVGKHSRKSENKTFLTQSIYYLADYLKTYPKNGNEIRQMLRGYFEGKTIKMLGDEVGKTRQYVYSRIEEGEKALAILLWGYFDKTTLQSL